MSFYNKLKKCGISVNELRNSEILITGATGMIGSVLAINLIELEEEAELGITILLMARNKDKVNRSLAKYIESGKIKLLIGDITDKEFIDNITEAADYIVHAASITESKAMIEKPVEVIMTNVCGTKNILDYAKKANSKSVVYLSSMEAYGFTENETLLDESNMQYLNPLALRSSYPESKRMAENLCAAYSSEYSVPVKIIRLAQTFGKGVKENDTRAFAEFARCSQNGKDIVLRTDGSSKRMYLDTSDAATAIITVMLKGKNGSAYNAANKDTYCSIAEMAKIAADNISSGKTKVCFDSSGNAAEYPPSHKFFLDTSKIESLGWHAETGLIQMYVEMISGWKC